MTLTQIEWNDLDRNLKADIDTPEPGWKFFTAPYEAATVPNQCYQIVYNADAQRGGIVFVGSGSSGLTHWTDAATPEEVLTRFLADDMIG